MHIFLIDMLEHILYFPPLRFSWEAITKDVSSREDDRLNNERLNNIDMICGIGNTNESSAVFADKDTESQCNRPTPLNVVKSAATVQTMTSSQKAKHHGDNDSSNEIFPGPFKVPSVLLGLFLLR